MRIIPNYRPPVTAPPVARGAALSGPVTAGPSAAAPTTGPARRAALSGSERVPGGAA